MNVKNQLTLVMLILGGWSIHSCDKDQKEIDTRTFVTKISLSSSKKTIAPGESFTITAQVDPIEASQTRLSWKTDDDDIVSLETSTANSCKCTIVAEKEGTAIITATSTDAGSAEASCVFNVKASEVIIESLSLQDTCSLAKNGKITLVPTITPKTASNKDLAWISSDETIASVDDDGKVIAKNTGSVIIYAMALDGSKKKDQCIVKVEEKCTVSFLNKNGGLLHTFRVTSGEKLPADSVKLLLSSLSPLATDSSAFAGWRENRTSRKGSRFDVRMPVDRDYTLEPVFVEYVDLDLPSGKKWAVCNIGADKETDFGDFYAWGATTTWYEEIKLPSSTVLTEAKFGEFNTTTNGMTWKKGYADGYGMSHSFKVKKLNHPGTLDAYSVYNWMEFISNMSMGNTLPDFVGTDNDVATQVWSENWTTPTVQDYSELYSSCYWEYDTLNGIRGYMVYRILDDAHKGIIYNCQEGHDTIKCEGYNQNIPHIFLPFAGNFAGPNYSNFNIEGCYWTSSYLGDMSFGMGVDYAVYIPLKRDYEEFSEFSEGGVPIMFPPIPNLMPYYGQCPSGHTVRAIYIGE